MNQESPFESYLTGRAEQIDVPGSGATAIADRARSRRRRRRAGSGAVLGVAVLLGGAVIGQGLGSDGADQEIESYGAGVVEPTLDWTTVPVGQGLGWSASMVQADSGAVYGLSTAPGAPDSASGLPRRLYGSADGTDWAEVPLPDGLSANALAADGDAVVAVGTSAAGGAVKVQLARSSSPGEGWSVSDIPLDLAAEAAAVEFPGRLFVAGTATAVSGGRTVVAVEVLADVDPATVLPAETQPDQWYATAEGMHRVTPRCEDPEGGGAMSTTTVTVAPTGVPADPVAAGGTEGCGSEGTEEVRTWAELGYGDDVARLVGGQTHVFASDDTGALQPATVVDGSLGFDRSLLAGDDGFWLIGPAFPAETETVVARRSVDGLDWSEAPIEVPGMVRATGVLEGRVTVLAEDYTAGQLTLHALSGVGVESFDLTELAGLTAEGNRYVTAAGIGPLGVAVAVTTGDGSAPGVVLHSIDGVGFSRTELPTAPDGMRQTVNGMTMTADAVKVRLNVRDADDDTGGAPLDQRLLVGTPR